MSYEWDLSPLYSGPDDPAIFRDLNAALQIAESLSKSFKHIPLNDPYELLGLVKDYEEAISLALRAVIYSELCYHSHVTDPASQGLYHGVRGRWIEVRERLRGVEAKLSSRRAIPSTWFETCPPLMPYRHWFEKLAAFSSYHPRDPQGAATFRALLRQREELLSQYRDLGSNIKIPGGLSLSEALSLMNEPNASFRKKIYANILDAVGKRRGEFAHILVSLVKNRLEEARLRGFSSPMKKLWLLNELGEGFGKHVVRLVERFYGITRNYLALKGRSVGGKQISIVDLHIIGRERSWRGSPGDALKVVSSGVGRLDPIFSGLLEELISNRCLDLEPRSTKAQGAICRALVPSIPPFIMMSFGGRWNDLATLAHEVGHAIHYMLSSESGCLNFRPVPVVEETMATFFEFLVLFEYSTRASEGPPWSMIMDILMKTLFRQNIITQLELWIYQECDAHPLDAQEISSQWLLLNRKLYGAEVKIPEPFGVSWALIPHIFEKPLYCSNYVVASLLALNLLNCALEDAGDFPPKLIRLLKAGSSRPAPDILEELIPGLKDMGFLQRAFTFMEKMLRGLGD